MRQRRANFHSWGDSTCSLTPQGGLKVQLFKGNGTSERIGPDIDLKAAYLEISVSFKPYNEYTMRVVKGTETLLTQTFRTSAGKPSEVFDPDWEMISDSDSHKANLHWGQPLKPNGPIDG